MIRMLIRQAIQKIKAFHRGNGATNPLTTRDQLLFGDADQELTGIIVTQWASMNVIEEAVEKGANLVISHEALFWNHGDHREWLDNTPNSVYKEKVKRLENYGIVVWRDHDFIHSGMPDEKGGWRDGIFYGLARQLGWDSYVIGDTTKYRLFDLPQTTAEEIASHIINSLDLRGAKIIGFPETVVKRVCIPHHNLGDAKDDIIMMERDHVDLMLAMELIDFTLSEYVRDAAEFDQSRAIVTVGHFNTEEYGMKYLAEILASKMFPDVKVTFAKTGDMYHYAFRAGKSTSVQLN